jgi:hypothetical protein
MDTLSAHHMTNPQYTERTFAHNALSPTVKRLRAMPCVRPHDAVRLVCPESGCNLPVHYVPVVPPIHREAARLFAEYSTSPTDAVPMESDASMAEYWTCLRDHILGFI